MGPNAFQVADLTKGKKIVIFGLPGAFTPTCSAKHVPSYVANIDKLKGKGVDEVWCVSVNDAFVMGAWAKDQKSERQGPDDGRRQRRAHQGARASRWTSPPAAWACARSATRCWWTTAW